MAVCGGSGSFLVKDALSAGAQAFITADFKYHQFFDGEGRLLIADIGHYESEQFTKDLIYKLLTGKFTTFAVRLSELNTNPINYFLNGCKKSIQT
ncbi:MAG: Nif3-like dinuclear metal center hexameric protein [Bacteroidetes bacterium]|nr:Nif3-like dinuclear metal center hexameric protein [Bacteroidota bacterium]